MGRRNFKSAKLFIMLVTYCFSSPSSSVRSLLPRALFDIYSHEETGAQNEDHLRTSGHESCGAARSSLSAAGGLDFHTCRKTTNNS